MSRRVRSLALRTTRTTRLDDRAEEPEHKRKKAPSIGAFLMRPARRFSLFRAALPLFTRHCLPAPRPLSLAPAPCLGSVLALARLSPRLPAAPVSPRHRTFRPPPRALPAPPRALPHVKNASLRKSLPSGVGKYNLFRRTVPSGTGRYERSTTALKCSFSSRWRPASCSSRRSAAREGDHLSFRPAALLSSPALPYAPAGGSYTPQLAVISP